MKRIGEKERNKAGHIYCPYCKPEKIDAVWRKDKDPDKRYDVACEKHKDNIHESKESEHYTEADYQTWLRL
jgi:uncharacterized Zn finger protein (UPF0148 family)